MSQYPGAFITFEGIEGCGKTTMIRLLSDRLASTGIDHLCTREPGGTAVGCYIRKILLDPDLSVKSPLCKNAELLLFAADRAQHVENVIIPALQAGRIVLCDRYIDSTFAYQGYGQELDLDLIDQLNQISTGGLKPNLTFWLDITTQLSGERVKKAKKEFSNSLEASSSPTGGDRIEMFDYKFWKRAKNGFEFLYKREADRFVKVDGSLPPKRILEDWIMPFFEIPALRLRLFDETSSPLKYAG